MKKIPVLIYTDIGDDIDDSLAIVYLTQCPEIDLVGIICDHKKPRHSIGTAKKLLQMVKYKAPILGSRHATFLKNLLAIHTKELIILSIGPTKQLSKDIKAHKKLFAGVKRIYFQGQVLIEKQKLFPDMQSYNFAQEPQAIQAILSSSIPKTFVGKYAAYEAPLTTQDFDILAKKKPAVRGRLSTQTKQWKVRFKKLNPSVFQRIYGNNSEVMSYPYDLVAAVMIVHEERFTKETMNEIELIGQKKDQQVIKNVVAFKRYLHITFQK